MIGAATICGRIGPLVVGSAEDRKLLLNMRDRTDASLMGAETVRVGDPEMRGSGEVVPVNRVRAIISMSGNLPVQKKKLFKDGPKPVIFTSVPGKEKLEPDVGEYAKVIILPTTGDRLSIQAAINELKKLGVDSLLIEGGGLLNYSCLRDGIVDEIYLTVTPKVSGDRNAAALVDGPGPLTGSLLGLKLVSCDVSSTGELFAKYKVINEIDNS